MSGYEALLEEYYEDKHNENITFSELGSVLESLTEFVNEEVGFTVEITLEEAQKESIKDKAAKIGTGIKTGIDNLIKKIKQFIERITDAIKKLIAKAKLTVAQGGNKALQKIIKDNKRQLRKAVKLKKFKDGDDIGTALLQKAIDTIEKTSKQVDSISRGDVEVQNDTKSVIDTFSKKIEKSALIEDVTVSAGSYVYKAYIDYIKGDLEDINGKIKALSKEVDGTKEVHKNCIKALQNYKDKSENKAKLSDMSAVVSQSMKINTYAINYAASLLGIVAKNSAKLALAAGGTAVADTKDNIKAAPGKIKDKFKKKKSNSNDDYDTDEKDYVNS